MSFSIKPCNPYLKKESSKKDVTESEYGYLFNETDSSQAKPTTGPNPTDPKHKGHCIHISNVTSSGSSSNIHPDLH